MSFHRPHRLIAQMTPPGSTTIVCDVSALVDPDVGTIGALARLHLTARQLGFELRLRHASNALQELLELVGLDEVLGVEPGGQPEEREERLGVEEEGQLDDPGR
jgi:anti-anti-sigma regulatory factor